MKRVYLFCTHGMSTSLLASKMQKVADAHNLPIEVKAFSDTQIVEIYEQLHPDVIMLGPQVKHKYQTVKDTYEPKGTPVELINMQDYGVVDGEKVLKVAIKRMKEGVNKT